MYWQRPRMRVWKKSGLSKQCSVLREILCTEKPLNAAFSVSVHSKVDVAAGAKALRDQFPVASAIIAR